MYLPFAGESNISNGSIITGSVTTMQPAWTTFVAAMTTAGFAFVIASYKLASSTNVSSVNVETILGTQRRRQGRLR